MVLPAVTGGLTGTVRLSPGLPKLWLRLAINRVRAFPLTPALSLRR